MGRGSRQYLGKWQSSGSNWRGILILGWLPQLSAIDSPNHYRGLRRCENRPPFVHSGRCQEEVKKKKRGINRGGWVNENADTHYFFPRKAFEPTGMIPNERPNPTFIFFFGSHLREMNYYYFFLRFKLALPCGFLNWAVGRLFPHQVMFCTSCDFQKNIEGLRWGVGRIFFYAVSVLFFSSKINSYVLIFFTPA